jgi:hypothetical protein
VRPKPKPLGERQLVFLMVVLIDFSSVASDVTFDEWAGTVARVLQFRECSCRGHNPAQHKARQFHGRSRNPASLAVARNCGIGSSCLNAEVKALDALDSVRGWRSSCRGLRY